MAVNTIATNIVNAAIAADTAITNLRAAMQTIADNERQLRNSLGEGANTFIMGRAGLDGIAAGKVLGGTPDTRTVEQIARAAWADRLA